MKNKEIISEGLEHCIANDCGGCPNLATEYCSVFNNAIKRAKAEAIKEFAERLKQKILVSPYDVNLFAPYTDNLIDNLVKEMTGEQE